ncbi:MAG: bifunctional diaminohydroxyphosphoribosylaminopyrimidine deaminase/5-amino-6-(5-phosphoribosylamino)uracil reductase RibD [Bacteroidota bacterium]
MQISDPFLQRCLELARIPGAAVEPNPRVGAVVVHQNRIIGEGFHRRYGGPHAEVNAVRSVTDLSLLPESTLYVSLEPCNHHGKTPPCTELILKHGIRKVVIGGLDPNPQMAGRSVAFLRERGVEVKVSVETAAFAQVIQHFAVNYSQKRPFVTLKWAESRDGFIAGHNAQFEPIRTAISTPAISRFVHFQRAQHQAILVGQRTVHIDSPRLTTRRWPGPDPIKIVFDPQLDLGKQPTLYGDPRTIVLNEQEHAPDGRPRRIRVDGRSLSETLVYLYREMKIGSILVEGGRVTLEHFLRQGCWDEAWRNLGDQSLDSGVPAPAGLADREPAAVHTIDGQQLWHYCRDTPANQ